MRIDHKGGRPTDYRPEYCERVIQLGRDGKDKTQIAAELGISKKTLYNWIDANPEFLHAIEQSVTLHKAYWIDILQKQAMGTINGSAPALKYYLNVTCNMVEKTKMEHSGTVAVTSLAAALSEAD